MEYRDRVVELFPWAIPADCEVCYKYSGRMTQWAKGIMRHVLITLAFLLALNGVSATSQARDRIVRVPDGIHCDTLRCAKAFIDAFAKGEQAGWRLYAMELGRRRAEAKSPTLAKFASYLFSLYVQDTMIVERGELELIEKTARNGATYYKIKNHLSEHHSVYVVPTKTKPPRGLRLRRVPSKDTAPR